MVILNFWNHSLIRHQKLKFSLAKADRVKFSILIRLLKLIEAKYPYTLGKEEIEKRKNIFTYSLFHDWGHQSGKGCEVAE